MGRFGDQRMWYGIVRMSSRLWVKLRRAPWSLCKDNYDYLQWLWAPESDLFTAPCKGTPAIDYTPPHRVTHKVIPGTWKKTLSLKNKGASCWSANLEEEAASFHQIKPRFIQVILSHDQIGLPACPDFLHSGQGPHPAFYFCHQILPLVKISWAPEEVSFQDNKKRVDTGALMIHRWLALQDPLQQAGKEAIISWKPTVLCTDNLGRMSFICPCIHIISMNSL